MDFFSFPHYCPAPALIVGLIGPRTHINLGQIKDNELGHYNGRFRTTPPPQKEGELEEPSTLEREKKE
jgi:hypothetical protein